MVVPSVLAVFAHPDDESLSAGGVLARHSAAGARTAVVTATWAADTPRAAELAEALRILGAGEPRMLGYADARVPQSAPGCARFCDAPLDEAVRRRVPYHSECRTTSPFAGSPSRERPSMPNLMPALPSGYEARPATADDVPAIHRLVAACERELNGRVHADPGGIAADLSRPGMVMERDTVLLHDQAGQLAAWAWVNRRSEVDVHPRHRGRGLGAALLDWAETRARQAGDERLVQTVPDKDTPATALLRSRGYERWPRPVEGPNSAPSQGL
ncbi:GNAT family N-acetyltransferase [Streptomyces sp. NPDC048506]|uniref:GNAT family N-acetyltransferase n=1 Tax=Streptomyces sp. NPDC048506 TaxID=3155028 RepID=UPI00342E25C1